MVDGQQLVGKPYTLETARLMRYGGTVNSKGIIVEVETEKGTKRKMHRCKIKAKNRAAVSLKDRLKSLIK